MIHPARFSADYRGSRGLAVCKTRAGGLARSADDAAEYWTFIQYIAAVHPDFLDTLAHVHDLSMPAVQRVAATVAERCALIANRYESVAIAQAGQTDPVGHISARPSSPSSPYGKVRGPVTDARPCAPSPGHVHRFQ